MNTYANRLVHAMKQRGINQTQLAETVGVKPQAIQYLCKKGKQSVHTNAICQALNIRAAWLQDGDGDMDLTTIVYIDGVAQKSQIKETQSIYTSTNASDDITEEEREILRIIRAMPP
jgi:DNA-binding Xre family transcriptional regulator